MNPENKPDKVFRQPDITLICPMWSEVPTTLLHNSQKLWDDLLVTTHSNKVIHILVVGIGKVKSAVSLFRYLTNYQPEFLYVLGTCGSLTKEHPIGTVLSPSFVEDLDFFCGELETSPKYYHQYDRFQNIPIVCFGCTDSFRTNVKGTHVVAVDMETHALCRVAAMFETTLIVYRVVSDVVGENKAPKDDSLPRIVIGEINKLARAIVQIHS